MSVWLDSLVIFIKIIVVAEYLYDVIKTKVVVFPKMRVMPVIREQLQ